MVETEQGFCKGMSAATMAQDAEMSPESKMDAEKHAKGVYPGEAPSGRMRSTRVYVGNLNFKVRAQDLHDHMRTVGEVRKVDIFEDSLTGRSKGCAIVEYGSPEEAEKAMEQLTDTSLFNRPIFVREDREARTPGNPTRRPYVERGGYRREYDSCGSDLPEGAAVINRRGYGMGSRYQPGGMPQRPRAREDDYGRQLFVSNLPYKTSWQELKDLFRKCGSVIRADVMTYPDGRSRGVGTVLFDDPATAEAAINDMHGYCHDGRQLGVRLDRC